MDLKSFSQYLYQSWDFDVKWSFECHNLIKTGWKFYDENNRFLASKTDFCYDFYEFICFKLISAFCFCECLKTEPTLHEKLVEIKNIISIEEISWRKIWKIFCQMSEICFVARSGKLTELDLVKSFKMEYGSKFHWYNLKKFLWKFT